MTGSNLFKVAAVLAIVAIPATNAGAAKRPPAHPTVAPFNNAKLLADAPHDARFERGYVCFIDHFHYGSSGTKPAKGAAVAAAISSWSSFVDFEYGGAWANFRKAGSRKVSCTAGSGGFDCSAEARPCQ